MPDLWLIFVQTCIEAQDERASGTNPYVNTLMVP
ncbi:hypothetical protein SAMN05421647_101621 [Marinobacterium stanieri]|uniref:Uncharacterized protein n=1 Tax=Marinobacterium stanieri TaxID=49186 RepID=A0A1N6NX11_9GAMM|nr:hypothetical protein SAMN05421647_101621 [Marinobacterium stanieri]